MQNNYEGCRDTQTEEQKSLNYKLIEVCSAPQPVSWIEKTNYKSYPIRDQDGSCQCVTMTLATEMGIIAEQKYGTFIDFSSCFPYQQRKYTSFKGCTSEDLFEVFPKIGNILEILMPSQKIGENACMAVPKLSYYDDLAKVFKIKRIALPLDFETVASTVQATGKGVSVWFKFDHTEWTNKPQVLVSNPTGGHSVTVVDFALINGKKYLVIQDSWGISFAVRGLRFISEEYFKARCYQASYLLSFSMQTEQGVRPTYISRSVSSAKDCFKWEGLFPTNIESNNVADNIYKTAVKSFQKRFGLTSDGIVGPITRQKLLELYK